MGQTTPSSKRDPSTNEVYLHSSCRGPGQKGRMDLQRHPQNKEKSDKEADVEENDDELDDLEMMASQLSGDAKVIQLLRYSKAVKNVGLYA